MVNLTIINYPNLALERWKDDREVEIGNDCAEICGISWKDSGNIFEVLSYIFGIICDIFL